MTSNKPMIWGVAGAVAVVIIAAAIFISSSRIHHLVPGTNMPATPAELPVPPSGNGISSQPVVEHPVPVGSSSGPAASPAALNDSDPAFHAALSSLPGSDDIERLLVPQNIIRHIVVTADNLTRKKAAAEQRPIKATSGQFLTASNGNHVTISPENYARYRPFMNLVKATNPQMLVAVYYRFYPLFQAAYDDLGYSQAYFNDQVVALIDNLVATPDVTGPVELVQPNVMYLYADPKLEALSSGQKTLIRMGPANEAIVKAKLKELRAALVQLPHPQR